MAGIPDTGRKRRISEHWDVTPPLTNAWGAAVRWSEPSTERQDPRVRGGDRRLVAESSERPHVDNLSRRGRLCHESGVKRAFLDRFRTAESEKHPADSVEKRRH